jgi:hypothetical protein
MRAVTASSRPATAGSPASAAARSCFPGSVSPLRKRPHPAPHPAIDDRMPAAHMGEDSDRSEGLLTGDAGRAGVVARTAEAGQQTPSGPGALLKCGRGWQWRGAAGFRHSSKVASLLGSSSEFADDHLADHGPTNAAHRRSRKKLGAVQAGLHESSERLGGPRLKHAAHQLLELRGTWLVALAHVL